MVPSPVPCVHTPQLVQRVVWCANDALNLSCHACVQSNGPVRLYVPVAAAAELVAGGLPSSDTAAGQLAGNADGSGASNAGTGEGALTTVEARARTTALAQVAAGEPRPLGDVMSSHRRATQHLFKTRTAPSLPGTGTVHEAMFDSPATADGAAPRDGSEARIPPEHRAVLQVSNRRGCM